MKIKNIGPGAIVAAAFIGPGTITTATIAGADYGYTLLWAVVFSAFSTVVLQDMSARLGLVTGKGLGEAIKDKIHQPFFRQFLLFLIMLAVFVGNTAYEAGNLSGAVIAYAEVYSHYSINPVLIILALLALIILFIGKYVLLEKVLIALVALMGFVFILSAILLKPDLYSVFSSICMPSIPGDSSKVVIGLIGTTVVPYNLFLHAATVQEKWKGIEALNSARWENLISIVLGGLITMAILICAAATTTKLGQSIEGISSLSNGIKVLFGEQASFLMGLGFLAAGFSSALTAPLAAAYVFAELMGLEKKIQSLHFRLIFVFIIFTGVMVSSIGFKPTWIIFFAQIANGLLLPFLAILLVWTMNDHKLMGEAVNSRWTNITGILIILVTLIIGAKIILQAIGLL